MKKVFKNEKETLAFAEKFAKTFRGGEVVALIGELGAGKTVFARGIALGLGIKERVQSPTFLLMKIYNVRPSTGSGHKIKNLVHVDAYRLNDAAGLVDIGFLEWFGRPDTVTVIEWADKVEKLLRGKKVIKIKMELGKKEEERIIEVISK
ncbi:MAG: tRNA (adenosine(37)-N6)-threonylcarbamoyltransferase complex ATPase subunit type 1 TsaE [Patescibacteria group bacterium]|jgi:tRNA threonylcarbamoyladenosine biosynthesis protein TsaE